MLPSPNQFLTIALCVYFCRSHDLISIKALTVSHSPLVVLLQQVLEGHNLGIYGLNFERTW